MDQKPQRFDRFSRQKLGVVKRQGMSIIFESVRGTVEDLANALGQLSNTQYTKSCITLSGSSIGQHVRHVVELFQCLVNGYETGVVNYDSRRRNQDIATHKMVALECLSVIINTISHPDKPMQLYAGFSKEDKLSVISTTYYREIVYNIEHTIHHMALIRIGITEASDIRLPQEFGVAPATLKYQAGCAR
jgi:hypothetical protein